MKNEKTAKRINFYLIFAIALSLVITTNQVFADVNTVSDTRKNFPDVTWPSTGSAYGTRLSLYPAKNIAYADINSIVIEYSLTTRYMSSTKFQVFREPYNSSVSIYSHTRTDVHNIRSDNTKSYDYLPDGSFEMSSSLWRDFILYGAMLYISGPHADNLDRAGIYTSSWKSIINYNPVPLIAAGSSSIDSRTIALNFNAMTDGTKGEYKLYRDNTVILQWAYNEFPDNLSRTDKDLNPNTTYQYKLEDPKGRISAVKNITTKNDVPSAPTISNITQTGLSLSNYRANNPTTTKYEIYREDMTAGTAEVKITSSAEATFNDSDLMPGHQYRYRIKAVQTNGIISNYSPYSNAIMIPPSPDVSYSVGEGEWHQTEGRGSVTLTWLPVPNANGYKVWVNDGYQLRNFDVGNNTSWNSFEWKIYPSETELDSYGNNTVVEDIFNKIKGGLDLRDNPNKLYLKTSGTACNSKTNYEFRISSYNNTGESNLTEPIEVTLPNRTDNVVPVVNSIVLNDGMLRTGNTNVQVAVSAYDVLVSNHTAQTDDDCSGLAKIQVSDDNFNTYSEIEWVNSGEQSGIQSFGWSIPPGEGTKNVYIRVVDKAGNVSIAKSGSVYLKDDNEAPTVNIVINEGQEYTTDSNISIVLNAYDDLTNVADLDMRFSFDGSVWTDWESFKFIKELSFSNPLSYGIKRVFIQIKDSAGNIGIAGSQIKYMKEEDIIADKIKARADNDTVSPVIETFMLLRGASATTSNMPNIELSVYDNITNFENLKVQFRLSASQWTSLETPDYVMTPNLVLNEGYNSLYVRVFDDSGNKAEKRISFFKL